jgi:hypothetical protein
MELFRLLFLNSVALELQMGNAQLGQSAFTTDNSRSELILIEELNNRAQWERGTTRFQTLCQGFRNLGLTKTTVRTEKRNRLMFR